MQNMHIPLSRTYLKFAAARHFEKQLIKENWIFSRFRQQMILNETDDWKHNYTPIDLRGKIVMSIGAGEGEDSRFFLKMGAAKVVAIELNPTAYRLLKINAQHHNIEAINEAFKLDHLKIPHDFLKIDIEGYEEALLSLKLDTPAVVEIHGLPLVERFRMHGWRIEESYGVFAGDQRVWSGCEKYGFWRC